MPAVFERDVCGGEEGRRGEKGGGNENVFHNRVFFSGWVVAKVAIVATVATVATVAQS